MKHQVKLIAPVQQFLFKTRYLALLVAFVAAFPSVSNAASVFSTIQYDAVHGTFTIAISGDDIHSLHITGVKTGLLPPVNLINSPDGWKGHAYDLSWTALSNANVPTPNAFIFGLLKDDAAKVKLTSANISYDLADNPNKFFPTSSPVPEPETYGMLMAGGSILGFMAKRRKQKSAP